MKAGTSSNKPALCTLKIIQFVVIVALHMPAIGQVDLNNGLVAYYPFSGDATDHSGYGNNATFNNATLTTDRFGNPNSAYFFNGANNYIQIPNSSSLNPKNGMSIALLFNTSSPALQTLVGKIDYAAGTSTQFQMAINYPPIPGALFGTNPASSGCFAAPLNAAYASTGAGTIATGQWNCLVGTFDNGVQKIYLNGALIQTTNAGFTTLNECPDASVQIGQWWPGDLQAFHGSIDEVRIYNRAITTDEVNALCLLTVCPPLQGTITGSSICSGNTDGYLTFHTSNTTGPFTLLYTDGTTVYTQTNVLDGVPFPVAVRPTVTTIYTLLAIEDASNCPPTTVTGEQATITVGSCSLCTGSLGDPVVNITFGSGSNPGQPLPAIVPGASTSLTYQPVTGNPASPTPSDGLYTITNNVPINADWFSGAPDHTPNDVNGYMAFYNASEQPGEFYRQTVDNLCGGTTYEFAAWIANVLDPGRVIGAKPDITFIIQQTDGTVLGVYDTGPVAQQSVFTWVQYGFFFSAPTGVSTVVLRMINNNPGGAANLGNDLAIDDITFRACGPVTHASFSPATTAVDSLAVCEGTDTTIYGSYTSGYANPNFLWQVSVDSGVTWTDIPNSNQINLPVAPPVVGYSKVYKYRMLIADGANINSPVCRTVSNVASFLVMHVSPPDFVFESRACKPLLVEFLGNLSLPASYDWLIAGFAETGQIALYNFPGPGSYPVTVNARTTAGCQASTTKTVTIGSEPADVITTLDTTICPGKSIVLRTTPALDFCWSPALGLDDPTSLTPKASPAVTTKYYFNATTTGNNLVVNGDFKDGNTGFTSGYTYDPINKTEGEYFVGTSPIAWNSSLPSGCGDHSTGSGNMLLINGSPSPGMSAWSELVDVSPNTNYAFSGWIESISAADPAYLQYSINGVALVPIAANPTGVCKWQQFYIYWNSGTNTTATISLVDQSIDRSGNDFAIDDVSFAPILFQTDSVTITIDNPPVKASPDTAVCPGAPAQLRANGAVTYSWTPGSGMADSTSADPVVTPRTNTSYIVTGTDVSGCQAIDTVVVSLFPPVKLIITPDTAICSGAAAQLRATGGSAYSWSPSQYLDNSGSADPVAHPPATTKFFLAATDLHTCSGLDSVTVGIKPAPVFKALPGESVCAGSSVTLGDPAQTKYMYQWSPASGLDDPTSPRPVANPAITTTYAVTISDSLCSSYDSTFNVLVRVNPTPAVTAQKNNDINCSTTTAQLNASGAQSYLWSPATGLDDPRIPNPVASVDSTTTFLVEGTDNSGCTGSDTITVKVTATGKNLFVVPNAFTPNGDGHNDCFGIRRWGGVTVEEFSIFDRWGVRVFTTHNPSDCWYGTFNGKMQPTGTYAYVIRAHSFCGEITRTGSLTLVR